MHKVDRQIILALLIIIPFGSLGQRKLHFDSPKNLLAIRVSHQEQAQIAGLSRKKKESLDQEVKWGFEFSTGINLINSRNAIIRIIEKHGFQSSNAAETTWLDQNMGRILNISGSIMVRVFRPKPVFVGLRAGVGNYCFVRAVDGGGIQERINLWNIYLNPNLQVGILKKPLFFIRGGMLVNGSEFHYQDSEESHTGTQLGLNAGTTFPLLIREKLMVAINLDYFYGGRFELGFPGFGNPEHLSINWLTLGASLWLFRLEYF